MSANTQLVNPMFKLDSISASAEFQPVEEPESEVPPVEFVAELVEVKLQELRLYSKRPILTYPLPCRRYV